jgi:UDP-N-acetylmuramate dehydrogenase
MQTLPIARNYPLLELNTFGLTAYAEHFADVRSVADLQQALQTGIRPLLLLGGGSNLLLTRDLEGLVLKISIPGIEVVEESPETVTVRVGAGENWHQFVLWAVGQGYGGVENLSLIPGTVGAAPVQNIGAYGVELKDVFVELEAVELSSGTLRRFSREACRFGYRDSIFKGPEKGRYCICSVTFRLQKPPHQLNVSYGDIRKTLETNGIQQPGIADVSRAVVHIRSSKLPDPAQIGNCGSFFKNPETSAEVLARIQEKHPEAPHYPLPDGRVKIPAGWLIEQCGWKGKRVGNTGCYAKQALVLVNHGGATGQEVKTLAYDIIASVEQRFGIRLEPEVNIL